MTFGKIIFLFLFCASVFAIYISPGNSNNLSFYYILAIVSFAIVFGKFIVNSIKNKISSSLAEKREEKEFQKQLRRKAQEEEVLGRARNKGQIELLGAQTKSLIDQMKAGEQVQSQLLAKYHELTAMGDSSYEYLKKEIKSMPAMKNVDFNL